MNCFDACALPRCQDLPPVTKPSYSYLFLGATFSGLQNGTGDGVLIAAILLSMFWAAFNGCKHVDTMGGLFDLPKSFYRPCGIAIGLAVWLAFIGINGRLLFNGTLGHRLLTLWEVQLRTMCSMQLAVWLLQGLTMAFCGVAWVVCWVVPSLTPPSPPTTSTTTPGAEKTSAPDLTTTMTGTADTPAAPAEGESVAATKDER